MAEDDIRSTIGARNEAVMAAFNRGDAAGIAELYTEDAEVLPPNADVVKGKEGVRGFWQATMDMGVKAIRLESVEVEQHGDVVNEIGRGTLFAENEQVIDRAKYVVIWKRDGGEWKLHRDIFNSNQPVS